MRRPQVLLVCAGLLTIAPTTVRADLTPPSFTGTPVGSWSYYEQENAGHGESTTYYPTTTAEFTGATFQGYVTYNAGSPPNYWFGQDFDSFQVFSTYVLSSSNVTMPVRVGSDDGHSLFLNNVFIGGGGFGVDVFYNLSLQAGVPTLLTVAGYNGPGGWEFGIRDSVTNAPLDGIPGVRISADGIFTPEPSTGLVFGLGLLGITIAAVRKRI